MTIKTSSTSHMGNIRTNNEDNYLIAPLSDDMTLALVADGVGGNNFGEVASQTIVDVFKNLVESKKLALASDITMRPALLEMAAQKSHIEVARKVDKNDKLQGMASTLCALIADGKNYTVVNVGDSRAYHYVPTDEDAPLRQISVDQTVAQEMIKNERLDPQEIRRHPDRNVLAQAIGIEGPEKPMNPETYNHSWQKGDSLILCSDGLSDMIGDAMILSILTRGQNIDNRLKLLVDTALSAGGKDNVTVIILENA